MQTSDRSDAHGVYQHNPGQIQCIPHRYVLHASHMIRSAYHVLRASSENMGPYPKLNVYDTDDIALCSKYTHFLLGGICVTRTGSCAHACRVESGTASSGTHGRVGKKKNGTVF